MAGNDKIGLDFFLGFGRALRSEGLQVGSAEFELFAKALPVAEVKSLREVYWVGRVCLTSSSEQIPIYDRVFQQWFQNAGDTAFPRPSRCSRRNHRRLFPNRIPLRSKYRQNRAVYPGCSCLGRASGSETVASAGCGIAVFDAVYHDVTGCLSALTAQPPFSSRR